MQVHDELVLGSRFHGTGQRAFKVLSDRMTAAAELKVPLLVEAGVGKDWGLGALSCCFYCN